MDPMGTTIQLGPFRLRERIGMGGFGEIYRAVHEETALEVAIKVVTAEAAREPEYLADFRREVRAVAGLDHPNIVQVFDYGLIPKAAAIAQPRLIAGSPYLVMELATGSVHDLALPMNWPTCRLVLHDLLSALAHAHARGLVHRDIKPGNMLLANGREGRILRLSDFGIAQDWSEKKGGVELDAAVGTPFYMAPEQFAGLWRDFGPWTDLYQVGILAYELAFGAYPFQGESFMAIGMQHMRAPLPISVLPADYPQGFDSWLRKMCAKGVAERFHSAAEASWALAALDEAGRPEPDWEGRGRLEFGVFRRRRADSGSFDLTMQGASGAGAATMLFDFDLPELTTRRTEISTSAPNGVPWQPMPPQATGSAAARLGSVGAGLFGLRAIPIVGRESVQEELWSMLREVRASGNAAAVVLRGGAGVGKSRIAAWLTQSADECGLGTPLVIRGERGEVTGGIGRALAEFYRCTGLKRQEVLTRIRVLLTEEDVDDRDASDALTELICEAIAGADTLKGTERPVRFGSPAERQAVFEQLLRRRAKHRPIVIWLDDAHFGGEALATMLSLLRNAVSLPFLLVVTCRDDLLSERALELTLMGELEGLSTAKSLRIDPLDEEAQHQLIASMLGLSGALAASIRMRAAGNPLFAIQIVGDLIERGELVGSRGGFAMRAGTVLSLPTDVRSLWMQRIDRAVAGAGSEARTALQLAALLGVTIDGEEFAALSSHLGLPEGPALLASVAGTGLLEQTTTGWRLAHPLLRDALEREARTHMDWMDWNYACAEVLAQRFGEGQRGLAARRALHLAEALAWGEALEAVTTAVKEALHAGETLPIPELLDRQTEMFDALRVALDDPRRTEALISRAEAYRLQWNFGAAAEWADRALAAAPATSPMRGEALLLRMHIARQQGDVKMAESMSAEALTAFRARDDKRGLGRTYLALAILLRTQGRVTESLGNYERALAEFSELEDEVSAARCRLGVAHLHRGQGRHRRALTLYEEALSIFSRDGVRNEVIQARIGLAEVARFEGRLAEAETAYLAALTLQRSMGDRSLSVTRCNLALVAIAQDRFDAARTQLELAETEMIQAGQKGMLVYVQVLLLACVAAAGEKAQWERQLAAATRSLDETGTIDLDLARVLERAGSLMAEKGLSARARDAWRLALRQFEGLEDGRGVARVTDLLETSSN